MRRYLIAWIALAALLSAATPGAAGVSTQLYPGGGIECYAGVGFRENIGAKVIGKLSNGTLDPEISHYQAQIDWGDSTAPTTAHFARLQGAIGEFLIKGSHVYEKPGTYHIVVNASRTDGSSSRRETTKVTVYPMASGIRGTEPASADTVLPPSNVNLQLVDFRRVYGFSYAGVGFEENAITKLQCKLNGQPDPVMRHYHAQINWGRIFAPSAAAAVDNPHVVTIHDVVKSTAQFPQPYIVME